jgi:hypothetical protein
MGCSLVRAQTVPGDSVRLIALPESGEIGFLIPRSAAIHYRNLGFEMVPALEEQIRLLESSSQQQSNLAVNRLQQIENLEMQRLDLQQQIDLYALDTEALESQLDQVNEARKRELRRKNFWRGSNYLFMGATAVLSVLVVID